MSLALALAIFLPCLTALIAGSVWLARGLRELGERSHMRPALLGLITALGADSPEITAAIAALLAGEHEVGVGVVLGSNLFNLAALLGLSPLLAGRVRLRRAGVLFNGVLSLVLTGIAALLILGGLAPAWSMALLALVFGLYVLALWLPAGARRELPPTIAALLGQLVGAAEEEERQASAPPAAPRPVHGGWALALIVAGSLALIVAGSAGLVRSTLRIASALAVPRALVGALALAALTGIPNAYTSARLARRREGAAVVSETLNSNTINIVVGIGLPALVFGVARVSTPAVLELGWLLGLTAVATSLATVQRGLRRRDGAAIIVLYLAFVAVRVLVA